MFPCPASSSVIFGRGSAEEGWRLTGFRWGVRSPPLHPAPSPRRDWGRRPNDLTAAGSNLLPWTFPRTCERGSRWKEAREPRCPGLLPTVQTWPGKMAQQTTSPDTLTVPEVDNPHCPNPWLNEDLVKSLRENLLQHEKSKTARKSVSPKVSPVISPRNSPRLLRRMLLSSNIPKQRRFTVAHTW